MSVKFLINFNYKNNHCSVDTRYTYKLELIIHLVVKNFELVKSDYTTVTYKYVS